MKKLILLCICLIQVHTASYRMLWRIALALAVG